MTVRLPRTVAFALAVIVLVAAGIVLALARPGRPPSGFGQVTATSSLTTAQPTDDPSIAQSEMPTSLSPSPVPEGSSTMSPDDELSRSDGFWAWWTEPILGRGPFDTKSLAEAADQADLIVRGRMSDLYVGEYWTIDETTYPLDYVRIEIAEVLKGDPQSRVPGSVEVQMGHVDEDDLARLRGAIPTEDALWFLMYGPNWGSRGDSPMASAEIAPFVYFISNEYQGVFRGIDGAVRLVQPGVLTEALGPDHFPLQLEGADYEEVTNDVRALLTPQ